MPYFGGRDDYSEIVIIAEIWLLYRSITDASARNIYAEGLRRN
jgi:hypothetical protein